MACMPSLRKIRKAYILNTVQINGTKGYQVIIKALSYLQQIGIGFFFDNRGSVLSCPACGLPRYIWLAPREQNTILVFHSRPLLPLTLSHTEKWMPFAQKYSICYFAFSFSQQSLLEWMAIVHLMKITNSICRTSIPSWVRSNNTLNFPGFIWQLGKAAAEFIYLFDSICLCCLIPTDSGQLIK